MPFGFALLFGIGGAIYAATIIVYWADKFTFNISGRIIVLSTPFLGLAITIFNLLASDGVLTVAIIVASAIGVITCAFHWIGLLIDKWKS